MIFIFQTENGEIECDPSDHVNDDPPPPVVTHLVVENGIDEEGHQNCLDESNGEINGDIEERSQA